MSNHKKYNCTKEDDTMENTSVLLPKVNIAKMLSKGQKVSSQSVLSDVSPVSWSNDVLNGSYKDKTIVQSSDK